MSNTYLRRLQALLKASPFVAEPRIQFDDRGEVLFIRADVYFIDNSLLHFRELFTGKERRVKQAYTYHYQRPDSRLVFRYDNSPHFPNLPTAPHHKHLSENEVVATQPPVLAEILQEIEYVIQKES